MMMNKKYRAELLGLLSRMIEIESINPSLSQNGNGENRLARFLGEYMESFGLNVHYQEIAAGRTNVIGTLKGIGGGKSLMFNGHLDTVGVEGMQISPFEPAFEDGKLYGRGSMDMKSGVAAQIIATRQLKESGKQLAGDVIVACVADEEYLSIGTEALIKEFSADAAVVTEPTNLEIMIAHKGFVWIKVQVEGKAAHGSRPEEGIDAIMKAGHVLHALDQWNSTKLSQQQHPLLGRASLHASIISGGTEISIYPAQCTIELERRTLPGENLSSVSQEIETVLTSLKEKDKQLQTSFECYFERKPLETPPEAPIVKILGKHYADILNKPVKHKGIAFWTDAALLAEAGIPTVVFGPTGEGLHSAVEYVEFESVVQTAEILNRLALDFCS